MLILKMGQREYNLEAKLAVQSDFKESYRILSYIEGISSNLHPIQHVIFT